jgi:hypothetical protein
MKKILYLGLLFWFNSVLQAQTLEVDSLMGLPSWYRACDSYQSCGKFLTCPEEYLDRNYFLINFYSGQGDISEILLTKGIAHQRLAVKGVAVMTITRWDDVNSGYTFSYLDTVRVEESVMLWNTDSMEGVAPTASVIWEEKTPVVEVAVPQCLMTMESGDSSKFLHFGLAELYFPRAVGLDSVFFIGGTLRNNAFTENGYFDHIFYHKPTIYPYIGEKYPDPCALCPHDPGHWGHSSWDDGLSRRDEGRMWTGPFFLILDTNHYRLTAMANDTAWGTVSGSGVYEPLEEATVEATPAVGYRFVRWDDGNVENPRLMEVACDTSIVAIFRDINDTTGIAGQDDDRLCFSLFPNPVREELFVSTTEEGQWMLELYDASGRRLQQHLFSARTTLDVSALPAGTYFVRLRDEKRSHIESFVKH